MGEDVATHEHVDAYSLVVPKRDVMLQLMCLLAQHMAAEPEYKVRWGMGPVLHQAASRCLLVCKRL